MISRTIRLTPFVLAIFPAVILYLRSTSEVPFVSTLPTLVFLVATTLALLTLAERALASQNKATFLISTFWIWLFSYDTVRLFLLSWPLTSRYARHRYVISAALIVLGAFVAMVARSRKRFYTINKYITVSCLVAFGLQTVAVLGMGRQHLKLETAEASALFGNVSVVNVTDEHPDIVYIILDSYSGAVELDTLLGFDNSRFVGFLKSRGFYVAPHSYSNYSWTALSMTSALNMAYLPAKREREDESLKIDKQDFQALIKGSRVVEVLKRIGYSYVDWSLDTYRIDSSTLGINTFNVALLGMTPLSRPLVENVLYGNAVRTRILERFEQLKHMPSGCGPVFVYAHLLIPHQPYVFDKTGAKPPLAYTMLQAKSERELYLDQLQFANSQVEEVIDAVLARGGRDPMMIIQGDHGAGPITGGMAANTQLRMSILNAYHVPRDVRAELYETISPVNSFRLVLRHFGAELPLLEDRHYFSETLASLQAREW